VIGLRLDRENELLLVNTESGSLTDAETDLIFRKQPEDLKGSKTYASGPLALNASSPLWPLSAPKFVAVLDPSKTLIAGDMLWRISRTLTPNQPISFGRVAALAYLTLDTRPIGDESNSHLTGSDIKVVIYASNPKQDSSVYSDKIREILASPELIKSAMNIVPEHKAVQVDNEPTGDWDDWGSAAASSPAVDDWLEGDDSGFRSKDDF
jgi:hypothetical protein